MSKLIILIRHAHSYKNLNDTFGGKGKSLTDQGIDQVKNIAQNMQPFITAIKQKVNLYVSCDRKQVVETAELLRDELNLSQIKTHPNYRPIYLGVFNNSTEEDRKTKYAYILEQLKQWENGTRDILDVNIPESEDVNKYFENIKNFVNGLEDGQVHILVGTRSDLSAIKNYANGNSPDEYLTYQFYKSDYAKPFCFLVNDDGKVIHLSYFSNKLAFDAGKQNEQA